MATPFADGPAGRGDTRVPWLPEGTLARRMRAAAAVRGLMKGL